MMGLMFQVHWLGPESLPLLYVVPFFSSGAAQELSKTQPMSLDLSA